jgi:hypothetical protein
VHPETKPTKAGGRNRRQGGDDVARFTADTAAKTGKPERTIQRDATGAKALGSDLDRVAGHRWRRAPNWTQVRRLDPSRQLSQLNF